MNWPFNAWLDLAVRIYGLTPKEFWEMSLYDWLSLLDQGLSKNQSSRPLEPETLSELMTSYPDKKDTI